MVVAEIKKFCCCLLTKKGERSEINLNIKLKERVN